MRIGALCNSLFGLPALNALAARGALTGVAIPALQHDATLRIHQLAQAHGLPFAAIQESGAGVALEAWLAETKLDTLLVLTFPYRLTEGVLAKLPLGVWNYHASPLPRHRGPDPIYWQLRNGARESAVTVHKMTAAMDMGPIAWAEPFEIGQDDTYGIVSAHAAVAAVRATDHLLALLAEHGTALPLRDQEEDEASVDPRPTSDDLCIDWESMSGAEVKALVQACNPTHGGAIAFLGGAAVRVCEVSLVTDRDPDPGAASGTLEIDTGTGSPCVVCSDGSHVQLDVLYSDDGLFSGSRFARAYGLQPGQRLDRPTRARGA